jgi:hypothetical protein
VHIEPRGSSNRRLDGLGTTEHPSSVTLHLINEGKIMKINSLCGVGGRVAVVAATWLSVACGSGGGDGSTPTPTTNSSFVNWTNSANGTVVKDWANQDFQVRSSDRTIVDASNTAYNGAVVDSSAKVSLNGTPIGSVAVTKSSTGTQIAVFTCNDGSGLVWASANGNYSYKCMSASSSSSSSGVGRTVSQTTPNDSYVTFTGSANGAVVVDSNNQQFRIRVSDNAVVDQSNAVLTGATVKNSTLTINGVAVASVSLANGSAGSKIAAFVCPSGDLLSFSISSSSYSWQCPSANGGSSSSGNNSGGSGSSNGGSSGSGSSSGSGGSNSGNSGSAGVVKFNVVDTNCSGNTCMTRITNTGAVRMSCTVNYYYSYPNGKVGVEAGLDSDQVAEGTGQIGVGQTGSAKLELNINFRLDSYSVNCAKWPFE